MWRLATIVCVGVLGVAGAAWAGPVAATLCSEGPAASGFGLAKIVGAPRVYLHTCTPGEAGCTEPPKTPYVIPGDEVIVGARSGDAICVAKPSRLGDTAGWVTEYQIALEPTPPAPASAWVGHWRQAGGDAIDLKLRAGVLAVSGAACWPACDTPPGKQTYGPHVGDLDGSGTPSNGRLAIGGADDCAAEMWLVGTYLVVFDNMGCGGMNVSFTGVYQRARGR
jgi:hypothetical protein